MMTNVKVKTPIGEGMTQGRFTVRDGQSEAVVTGVLVRLPINDVTRSELNKSNCVTPSAEHSGLWVFSESELA